MRGQAHTLEAVTAALLLLGAVLFALQTTAVTPLTASTSSQHIENQQAAVAEGVLVSAAEEGTLKPTLLYWNESASGHWNADYLGAYTRAGPPTALGETLNGTFLERGIAFNLNVHYVQNGQQRAHRVVNFGEPSDNAVSATKTVTLYDDDVLRAADRSRTTTTLAATDQFYVDDDAAATQTSGVYNVVVVEVVVWRM